MHGARRIGRFLALLAPLCPWTPRDRIISAGYYPYAPGYGFA